MGDWIWVLITALITFVSISFINLNPPHESQVLNLDFSNQNSKEDQLEGLKQAISDSLWKPQTEEVATHVQNEGAHEAPVGIIENEENHAGSSVGGGSLIANRGIPLWLLPVLMLIVLIGVRLVQFFRHSGWPKQQSTHTDPA